jgi:hypothetical protein
MTSTSDFAAFWTTVATQFKDNDLVIFDTSKTHPVPPQRLLTHQTTNSTPKTKPPS